MKYLTIFKVERLEAAEAFTSKTAAEKFINDCAKAAKTKALKNQEGENYLLEVKDKKGQVHEIEATIQTIDASLKYELTYDQNEQRVETSFHQTRKALITQAQKILDQLGYEATSSETEAGRWIIDNPDQNLKVVLTAKLAVVGSEGENIIADYANPDLKSYFKKIDDVFTALAIEATVMAEAAKTAARKRGFINLGIGLAIAAGGALLSFISFETAKPGEKYTVFTGLIVVGIIDALCGIYYIIRPKAALKKQK